MDQKKLSENLKRLPEDQVNKVIKEELEKMIKEGFFDRLKAKGAGAVAGARGGLSNVGTAVGNAGRFIKTGDPGQVRRGLDPAELKKVATALSVLKSYEGPLDKLMGNLKNDLEKLFPDVVSGGGQGEGPVQEASIKTMSPEEQFSKFLSFSPEKQQKFLSKMVPKAAQQFMRGVEQLKKVQAGTSGVEEPAGPEATPPMATRNPAVAPPRSHSAKVKPPAGTPPDEIGAMLKKSAELAKQRAGSQAAPQAPKAPEAPKAAAPAVQAPKAAPEAPKAAPKAPEAPKDEPVAAKAPEAPKAPAQRQSGEGASITPVSGDQPAKRGRGRPPGSKNRPKDGSAPAQAPAQVQAAPTAAPKAPEAPKPAPVAAKAPEAPAQAAKPTPPPQPIGAPADDGMMDLGLEPDAPKATPSAGPSAGPRGSFVQGKSRPTPPVAGRGTPREMPRPAGTQIPPGRSAPPQTGVKAPPPAAQKPAPVAPATAKAPASAPPGKEAPLDLGLDQGTPSGGGGAGLDAPLDLGLEPDLGGPSASKPNQKLGAVEDQIKNTYGKTTQAVSDFKRTVSDLQGILRQLRGGK